MSVLDRIRSASARLGPDKWKRAAAALRKYGVREFVRRGAAKLRGKDNTQMDEGRRLIVTNESYYAPRDQKGFIPQPEVTFRTAPSRDNITQIAIRTVNSGGDSSARLRLEVSDGDRILASGSVGSVADGEDTVIRFPVLRGVFGQMLQFHLIADGSGTGILVNQTRERDGFTVDGGGSVACRVYGLDGEDPYQEWISWNDPTPDELEQLRREEAPTAFAVALYVIAETAPMAEEFLRSLSDQTYGAWHAYILCPERTQEACSRLAALDSRYTCVPVPQGEDPLVRLLQNAEERYVALADPTILLAPHALSMCAKQLREDPDAEFIYFDEDVLSSDTAQRTDPFFKPDYSPNLLLSFNYIGSFFVASRALIESIDAASTYDFVLQASDAASGVRHIPDVLYHARAQDANLAREEDRDAVRAALRRRGIEGSVRHNPDIGRIETDYALPEQPPRVSILIPSHDAADMLRDCVSSILEKTTYPNYEVVIVENNSKEDATFQYYKQISKDPRVRILTWNNPFNFAAINNWAVQQTQGDLLLFLNNDTTVIAPDWIERMAALCARPDVGAVGAKLLYPDDTVQHGGVVMRMMGIAGHAHLGAPADSPGSFGRLATPFDVSGATGACLMIPRDVFNEVDGFDEQYVLAFNDVDICLKIRELGLSILFEPRAQLYHYESKTRGYEITPAQQKRFRNEQIIWVRRWLDKYPGDPFYNPNLRYDTCGFDTAPEKRGASMARMTRPYDELIDAEIEPL